MIFGLSVDEATQDWVLDSFGWAIDQGLLSAQTRIITPSRDNFPAPKDPRKAAPALVAAIQSHLGINVPVEVVPLDKVPAEYRLDYNALAGVGGTFATDGETVVISYDESAATQPIAFLSTLVHEVMHLRLHGTDMTDMPGGPEAEELSTDLHCITTGFGAIQMAGAEQAGWQGYLRQETRAFALAVFLDVTGEAMPALPARSLKLVKKAARLVAKRSGEIADLRAGLA